VQASIARDFDDLAVPLGPETPDRGALSGEVSWIRDLLFKYLITFGSVTAVTQRFCRRFMLMKTPLLMQRVSRKKYGLLHENGDHLSKIKSRRQW